MGSPKVWTCIWAGMQGVLISMIGFDLFTWQFWLLMSTTIAYGISCRAEERARV